MDDTGNHHERQVLLSDPAYLFADCWAIPYVAMHELGSASQTLGAFERLFRSDGTTFASTAKIAQWGCVSPRACERHNKKLISKDWITHAGRQRRRTVTYKATQKFINAMSSNERVLFPRFSGPEWTWSMRCVFAVVANAQLAGCVGIRDANGEMPEDLSEECIYRSIKSIAARTGLTRNSTRDAITQLMSLRYLDAERTDSITLILSVGSVPMPQIGWSKVTEVDWSKVTEQKQTRWSKVAVGVVKNDGCTLSKVTDECSKVTVAVNTISKTICSERSSSSHCPASANASPDSRSDDVDVGKEEGRKKSAPTFEDFRSAYPSADSPESEWEDARVAWDKVVGGLFTPENILTATANYVRLLDQTSWGILIPKYFLTPKNVLKYMKDQRT